MEINIEKIKSFSAITSVQFILELLIPGVLFMYIFNRESFLSLYLIYLIFLSISTPLPIISINSITIYWGLMSGSENEDEFQHNLTTSIT